MTRLGGQSVARPPVLKSSSKLGTHLSTHWKVDSDDIQELLDQEVTDEELIEMYEQEQDIEELRSLDTVQLDDRMMVGDLIEGFHLTGKRYKFHLRTALVEEESHKSEISSGSASTNRLEERKGLVTARTLIGKK
ncbi:hypothetical protein TNCV_2587441 [Trichonephila clavipes]|nr:hypothetical protein TNCV_2587441 [Trichonephila clavipes]